VTELKLMSAKDHWMCCWSARSVLGVDLSYLC